ncbi:ER lectin-like protein [Perilla frutescens var. hirtella]|uniref:Protein OS-9 homolog n=1 Tax=Perilla frutescens var. hirtella TaxID=608512 RepID=A0AAD4J627_PERFH|nr:ER lectin-like protein [Perilla frutescens var. hirtella]KAH6817362.1 ER lectin-like protein [Perilla frutescens var. frutescens]KAH6827556.1 ER lectin-like protein [Perilla frutescens var. hirtella]
MRFTRWLVAALVASVLLCDVVFPDQTVPAQTGGTFGRSSREPKFKIEFHTEDSPFHPDEDQESITMPNKNGEKFICYLPKVEKSKSGKPVAQQNLSSMIVESETRMKLKTPDELLEVLKERCFIRQEGWWSYEFCYQHGLRQIHLEDEKVVQEFVLGVYDAEATEAHNQNLSDVSILKDPRSKDASQRYHAHIFNNGTLCDLTNEPRETEVRFVCSEPRAMISSITELSTCKYALTFQCPTLCKHPLFHEERPVSHTIHCNALPKEEPKVQAEADNSRGGMITMVTDAEYAPTTSTPEE